MHVNDTRWGEGHLNYIYRSIEIEQYEQPRKLWEVWQLIETSLGKNTWIEMSQLATIKAGLHGVLWAWWGGVELHGARRVGTGPHWKGKFNRMELERWSWKEEGVGTMWHVAERGGAELHEAGLSRYSTLGDTINRRCQGNLLGECHDSPGT